MPDTNNTRGVERTLFSKAARVISLKVSSWEYIFVYLIAVALTSMTSKMLVSKMITAQCGPLEGLILRAKDDGLIDARHATCFDQEAKIEEAKNSGGAGRVSGQRRQLRTRPKRRRGTRRADSLSGIAKTNPTTERLRSRQA